MNAKDLARKLEQVGELSVVGIMIYYMNCGSEDFRKVDYFNEVQADDLVKYIEDNKDEVVVSVYDLETTSMASGKTVFVTDYEELTFGDLLSENVFDVNFYTLTKVD